MDNENTITVNGHVVEFHHMAEDGRISFKLDNTLRDPMDFIIPGVTAFEFLSRVAPFWSTEKPKERASNGEMRRWLDGQSVRFNGVPKKAKDVLDFPVYSVVLFPKGKRITLL